jgi:hypothetical protein
MNSDTHRGNVPALVALCAAIGVFVSMVLPWLVLGYLSASYVDVMSGRTTIAVGWLTAGLLIGGPLVAAIASGSSLLNSSRGRRTSRLAVAGFVATLGGFGLWLVLWGQVDRAYGWLGVQMGTGELVGIASAITGLVAAIIDLRSAPLSWAPQSQPGPWSSPGPAPQMPPAAYRPPALASWPGPVPAQPVAPVSPFGATAAGGRISYVEGGRPSTCVVNSGDRVLVGRDAQAQIRLTDPRVSRRHAAITWSGTGWSVTDLGATNPTRVLDHSGNAQPFAGELHITSGQLLIGDALVTLFPPGA